MKDYKRLTERYVEEEGGFFEKGTRLTLKNAPDEEILERLAELEDKIEKGTLIFIDEPFYSECNNCWAVFQRTDDNVITCEMTERQARNYKKFKEIE